MALAHARVSLPEKATRGEIVEIKTLIRHPMETGYRVDSRGRPIPRDIITSLTVTYAGEKVFFMDMSQGVAANPFIAFHTRAVETGELVFRWEDLDGEVTTVRETLTVEG